MNDLKIAYIQPVNGDSKGPADQGSVQPERVHDREGEHLPEHVPPRSRDACGPVRHRERRHA